MFSLLFFSFFSFIWRIVWFLIKLMSPSFCHSFMWRWMLSSCASAYVSCRWRLMPCASSIHAGMLLCLCSLCACMVFTKHGFCENHRLLEYFAAGKKNTPKASTAGKKNTPKASTAGKKNTLCHEFVIFINSFEFVVQAKSTSHTHTRMVMSIVNLN